MNIMLAETIYLSPQRLWERDTDWAEAGSGAALMAWAIFSITSPAPLSRNGFGPILIWISQTTFQNIFLVVGLLQLMALFTNKCNMRLAGCGFAAFLNLSIVYEVIFGGIWSMRAMSYYMVFAALNLIAIIKIAGQMQIRRQV